MQNAAQVAIDNSTITTSITANVITFTGYTPTSADVGNVVQMLTGTNVTAGFYEITAQTGTTWTVTGAVSLPTSGTTTNATGNMGGALATLNKLVGGMVANNWAYVTGAFTSTATLAGVLAVNTLASPTNPPLSIIGYGATRGDGVQATLTLQTNTGLIGFNCTGSGIALRNLAVDCSSLGTSTGFVMTGATSSIRNCKASNFTLRGFNLTPFSNFVAEELEATGGTSAASVALAYSGVGPLSYCFIHDNACAGVGLTSGQSGIRHSLIVNNSGASSDGITCGNANLVVHNTIHNNGRDGIRVNLSVLSANQWLNNIISNNGGWGINNSGTALAADPLFDGNAYYSNTSGTRNGIDSTTGVNGVAPYTNVRDVILSGSPYVGGTAGSTANFALNNTAGAGAAARAAGVPSTWPGNTGTTGYIDMGAVQHQDTGGSGGGPGHVLVVRGQNLPAY